MIGKLATKIAAASNDVGGKLNPDKRNQDQKYDYVSADKILAVCGQALATQGVVVFPGITKSEIVMTERTGKSSRYDATIELGITVTDGETEYACAWIGLGSDYMTPDKALYKAVTSGHKYFLMKLLNVGAGNEDGEHEGEPEQEKKPSKPAPRPSYPPEAGDVDREENEGFEVVPTRLDTLAKMLVELKIVENEFHAKGALRVLDFSTVNDADAINRVRIYRAWRDHDPKMSKDDCKTKAIAGELPQ
jgi:hypothetical protein